MIKINSRKILTIKKDYGIIHISILRHIRSTQKNDFAGKIREGGLTINDLFSH